MSLIQVTNSNALPTREIQIRNAIKDVIRGQGFLKDWNIKKIHNAKMSSRGWSKPYIYVIFRGRVHREEETDIANFAYGYLFEIGVVADLKSMKEDNEDDYLLNIMTLVESSLSINKRLLDNVILHHYPHEIERDDSGLTDSTKHIVLRVQYTQDVPLGS